MLYVYTVASAALLVVFNNIFGIFTSRSGWWETPLIFMGLILGFILLHLAVLCVWISLISVKKPPEKGAKSFRKLIDLTLPMLFSLARVKIHISGEDKLPDDTNRVMVVCNHLNDIDPAVLIKAMPRFELGFVAKKEIYTDLKFVAKAMHKLYCIPIDRENNREGAKAVINAAKLIKEDKASVGIFPEGYTSKDGELQPLRNGAFKIAVRANVPIVVCTLVGMRKIEKRIFIKHTDVYLDICDVIPADEVAVLHTDAIGERVYGDMKKSIENRRLLIAEQKRHKI